MKMLWCWRCRAEVPMLDDEEFRRITSLKDKGEGTTPRERMFSAVLREYERVTGFPGTNPNAIYHHQLSQYGPPCSKCGKPLRTPQAKLCGSCMHNVEARA
jgi:hypothetical protein